jgi:hypothetical protein
MVIEPHPQCLWEARSIGYRALTLAATRDILDGSVRRCPRGCVRKISPACSANALKEASCITTADVAGEVHLQPIGQSIFQQGDSGGEHLRKWLSELNYLKVTYIGPIV